MAEVWVAGAAVVAGAVITSEGQKDAANKAARAQRDAASQGIAATQENYVRTATDLNPYIDAGKGALTGLNALAAGDYSGFENSPDFKFSLSQGLQGLDRSAAARGSLYSGGHSADVLDYAQGLASRELGSYRGSLMGLAGMGQGAASNLGSVGTGNAAAIGSYATNAANATANAAINSANANSNMYGQLAGLAGQYMGQRGSPTNSSYNLGGNGLAPYQVNDGSFQNNGTFNFATAGRGVGG